MQRRYTFNTAIAAIMELLNDANKFKPADDADRQVLREALESATLMLSPVIPHVCHEVWNSINSGADDTTIIDASWPVVDESALVQDKIEMVVQVNGKLRCKITVANGAENSVCEEMALAEEAVKRHTDGKTVRKVIVVPNKLVNIVVS